MDIATYKILINNIDATADISPCLKSLTYTDNIAGISDEAEIILYNLNGLFSYEWMPKKGSSLECEIHFDNKILQCGSFEIDETECEGSKDNGDTVIIKGLGAGVKESIRTIKSSAHEKKTLKEIAVSIAGKYGFKVVGNIPNIKLGRVTQHRETDLHFLDRIAVEFGLTFSIRGKQMVFHSIFDLEAGATVMSFKKSDLESFKIKDKSTHIYNESQYLHYNIKTKKKNEFITTNTLPEAFNNFKSSDFLIIPKRVENNQQAELKSKAALRLANTLQQEGNIILPGKVECVAGINIQLEELGWYSGVYHITKSVHTVSKDGGYKTDLEIKRIGLVTDNLMKPTS